MKGPTVRNCAVEPSPYWRLVIWLAPSTALGPLATGAALAPRSRCRAQRTRPPCPHQVPPRLSGSTGMTRRREVIHPHGGKSVRRSGDNGPKPPTCRGPTHLLSDPAQESARAPPSHSRRGRATPDPAQPQASRSTPPNVHGTTSSPASARSSSPPPFALPPAEPMRKTS